MISRLFQKLIPDSLTPVRAVEQIFRVMWITIVIVVTVYVGLTLLVPTSKDLLDIIAPLLFFVVILSMLGRAFIIMIRRG